MDNRTLTNTPAAKDTQVSAFLLEVVKNALDTIADELALIIMRTAYSSIVRDAMDYSTAICDRNGQTLAQGLTTPLHLGSFFDAMANLVANHAPSAAPGDVYIFNDPYLAAGQHRRSDRRLGHNGGAPERHRRHRARQ